MSLALNSREAMPDGGELTITAENAVMRDAGAPFLACGPRSPSPTRAWAWRAR